MELAYVREIGDTTGPEVVIPLSPSPTPGGSSSAHDAAVDAITGGISRLGGSWDEKKKEQWENDEDPPGVGEVEAMTPTPHEPPTPYSEMEEVTPTPQQEADVETPTSPS
ncbi:hypothetical protein E4U24_008160 [Claviceps purpurea]|nr:hypothetical protein E4U51_001879 [Claviceps purpurea]KAG6249662.1 hypothetical protein E4U23_002007 [Claviceps purpurea]KAG6253526.1 hypothetical protein E4U24_008160 [Claviceps purpurea]